MGIDDAGESGIPCAPGLWPSIAMLDWDTAQPNARFRVLKLIYDNFRPGDKIVETSSDSGYVMTQAFVSPSGEQKLLIVNKRDREFEINLPGPQEGKSRSSTRRPAPSRPAQPPWEAQPSSWADSEWPL